MMRPGTINTIKRSHDHLAKRSPKEFINYWLTLKPEKRSVITVFDNEN